MRTGQSTYARPRGYGGQAGLTVADRGTARYPLERGVDRPAGPVQAPARVNVTCVTPLGDDVASTS